MLAVALEVDAEAARRAQALEQCRRPAAASSTRRRLMRQDHVALLEAGAARRIGGDAEDERALLARMRRSARMAGVTVTSWRSCSTVHLLGGDAWAGRR